MSKAFKIVFEEDDSEPKPGAFAVNRWQLFQEIVIAFGLGCLTALGISHLFG